MLKMQNIIETYEMKVFQVIQILIFSDVAHIFNLWQHKQSTANLSVKTFKSNSIFLILQYGKNQPYSIFSSN